MPRVSGIVDVHVEGEAAIRNCLEAGTCRDPILLCIDTGFKGVIIFGKRETVLNVHQQVFFLLWEATCLPVAEVRGILQGAAAETNQRQQVVVVNLRMQLPGVEPVGLAETFVVVDGGDLFRTPDAGSEFVHHIRVEDTCISQDGALRLPGKAVARKVPSGD